METYKKIISIILTLSFLVYNTSFAFEPELYNLAAPSRMGDINLQHAVQMMAGIRLVLKESGIRDFDLETLRELGVRDIIQKSVFREKVKGKIFFGEVETIASRDGKENYAVRATVDNIDYVCIISKNRQTGFYDIYVAPYKKYVAGKERDEIKVLYDSIDEKTRRLLNSYVEHEVSGEFNVAIDEWISERMERGEYAVDESTVEKSPYKGLYKPENIYKFEGLNTIISRIRSFLTVIGLKNVNAIIAETLSKPIVLIPYDKGDLPSININGEQGERVDVTAHSSAFATYIFVERGLYKSIIGKEAWSQELIDYLEEEVLHEMAGARCGLEVAVKDSRVVNIIDALFKEYKEKNRPERIEVPKQILDSIRDIKPVDLLQLEMRIDLASGRELDKKNLFKRVMAVILSGCMSVLGIPVKAHPAKVEMEVAPKEARTTALPVGVLGSAVLDALMGQARPLTPEEERPAHEKAGQAPSKEQVPPTDLTAADINIPSSGEFININSGSTWSFIGQKPEGRIYFRYRTGGNPWDRFTGFGIKYDNSGTTPVESVDLSALPALAVGLRGDGSVSRVKLDIEDIRGEKATVYLEGVESGRERIWSIPTSLITSINRNIDLAHVQYVIFVVEGDNMEGVLEVNVLPKGAILPSPTLTAADINEGAGDWVVENGATWDRTYPNPPTTGQGKIDYATTIERPWAFAGYVHCSWLREGGMLIIGMRGDRDRVKIDVEDASGRKASVYIAGVRPDREQIWSIPTSLFQAQGVNLKIYAIMFVVESTEPIRGSLYPHLQPYGYVPPAPTGVRGGWEKYVEAPGERPEEERIARAVIAGMVSRADGTRQHIDEITETLWQAGQDGLSMEETEERLSRLVPPGADKYTLRALITLAMGTVLTLTPDSIGRYKMLARFEIKEVAKDIVARDIKVFMSSSLFPKNRYGAFRRALEVVFGDRLTLYEDLEELKTKIKDPANSIVMTLDLTDKDAETINRLGIEGLKEVRFMNFESRDDIDKMNDEEHTNYIAETLGILLVARLITAEEARDENSVRYQLLAHLLEHHMPEIEGLKEYIVTLTDNTIDPIARLRYLLKTILKAIPIVAYKLMRPAVEILWSA